MELECDNKWKYCNICSTIPQERNEKEKKNLYTKRWLCICIVWFARVFFRIFFFHTQCYYFVPISPTWMNRNKIYIWVTLGPSARERVAMIQSKCLANDVLKCVFSQSTHTHTHAKSQLKCTRFMFRSGNMWKDERQRKKKVSTTCNIHHDGVNIQYSENERAKKIAKIFWLLSITLRVVNYTTNMEHNFAKLKYRYTDWFCAHHIPNMYVCVCTFWCLLVSFSMYIRKRLWIKCK